MHHPHFLFPSVLILLGIVPGSLVGQAEEEIWSLEQCVNYALENNIQVQTAALQSEINDNNRYAAWWDYAPNLALSGNVGWNFGLNIDPVTNIISQNNRMVSSLNLTSAWVLYDGGRKHNTIAQRNLQYLTSVYDLEAAKNDISLNVASAFLQILLNREMLEVAREQENISLLQVEQTRKLVEAGSAPRGDLLQFEAQLARDRQSKVEAQNNLLISRLQLANILLLPEPDQLQVEDPELAVPDASLLAYTPGEIFDRAVNQQPVIKAAEKRVESSEKDIALSQSGYKPTLSLQGQLSTSYSDQIVEVTDFSQRYVPQPRYEGNDPSGNVVFDPRTEIVPLNLEQKGFADQVTDNRNEFIGINLRVPLFNRMQVKTNVQNAKLQREISQLQLEQEKNQLRQTIYQSHADALGAFNSYQAAQKSVEFSQESFDYARERFELGAINQFDFENAKNALARAQSEMLRAKYDYIFKVKVLEFYLTNQVQL